MKNIIKIGEFKKKTVTIMVSCSFLIHMKNKEFQKIKKKNWL
jgi:hypothetical protein